MDDLGASRNGTAAREIAAALEGRRFGICGYDMEEGQRVTRFLSTHGAIALPIDERLLCDSVRFCDGILFKLGSATPQALQSAATKSTTPILVTGPAVHILRGLGGAYDWPADFMSEPLTEAELVVRLFRLLQPGGRSARARLENRNEPLVLLADDDPALIALVELTLRNDGIASCVAPDGLSALRLAREVRPDLAVLDVRMPVMDGFEVLETLRHDPALQSLPVVLLTGCDSPDDVIQGAKLQADEYLSKPVSPIRLLSRLKRLLARSERNSPGWLRPGQGTLRGAENAGRPWMLSGDSRADVRDQN